MAATVLALAAAGAVPALAATPSAQVEWLTAASDQDVGAAFDRARAQNKPVLLYWGATWCPPCNRLKATLFNRQDFAAASRSFVAVHVDGDKPGAQRLGSRFKVSGYPSVVLFSADGTEITRLPGEVEPEQMMALLQQGMAGGRPVKDVLADARSGKALSAGEWRMLAFYAWSLDEQQLVAKGELPALLARLAAAVPAAEAETSMRLWLKALAAAPDAKGAAAVDAAVRERVLAMLADPVAVRRHTDQISNHADDIVRALQPSPGAARDKLVGAFDGALRRLQSDAGLSRGDRLDALIARVALARLDLPPRAVRVDLPVPLRQEVSAMVEAHDREIRDGYERQDVITAGAYALGLVGLWSESDALLKANLARSHSPYYLMSQLGGNARKLGRHEEALGWYEQAWHKSVGPATRLQWGSNYLKALVELAPQKAAPIERTAASLIEAAGQDSGAFEGRSVRSLQRMARELAAWNAKGERGAALGRLRRQLDAVCAGLGKQPESQRTCQGLMTAEKAAE